MLSFLSMVGNHEQRKVDRYESDNGLIVDTAAVTDSEKPYETGICHPAYNSGDWVIVELYDTKEEAQAGHSRWVQTMTAGELPQALTDVSTCEVANLLDVFSKGDDWRTINKD